jgi:hypothetical protein
VTTPGHDPVFELRVTNPSPDDPTTLHLTYEFITPGRVSVRPKAMRYKVTSPRPLINELCAGLRTAATAAADHRDQLRSRGGMLFKLLFPADSDTGQLMVSDLRAWDGPLVITSEEDAIPWELLFDQNKDQGFFGLAYSMGHQLWTGEVPQQVRSLDRLRTALIVSNPTGDLAFAAEEAAALAELLRAKGVQPTVLVGPQATAMAVMGALCGEADGTGPDLFHYFGHVTGTGTSSALNLADGGTLDLGVIERMLPVSPERGGGAPPVVFINGCASATNLAGLCGAFMSTGAQVVIGTLFDVSADTALAMARHWYQDFLSGETVGEALRRARAACRLRPDGSWAAFALFGDPTFRMPLPVSPPVPPRGGPPDAKDLPGPKDLPGLADPPEPDPDPELPPLTGRFARLADDLESDADQVLRRAARLAADLGVMTTAHLAAALILTEGSALAEAVDAVGVPRLMLADLLCRATDVQRPAGGQSARPAPGPNGSTGGDLQTSGNAWRAIEAAVGLARSAQRARATTTDLVEGFLHVGGGAAGDALRALGVSAESIPPDIRMKNAKTLFDDDNNLLVRYLEPDTRTALRAARLLAAGQNSMISSGALIVGFGLAGSLALRRALLEQGTPGEAAVQLLFPDAVTSAPGHLRLKHFSSRAFTALDLALKASRESGAALIGDAAILAEALADERSSASGLLRACGVDREKLRASLQGTLTDGRNGGSP